MREINTCLKLNFFSRKIPILIGSILLTIIYVVTKKGNLSMGMDSLYVRESLFLIFYAMYNYKNSFIHWISMGGRRKEFYLSSFILFVFTAAVASYVQSLIFIQYASQNQMFLGYYGKLDMLQVGNFTPLELWFYQFLGFMTSISAGSFLGVLNTKCSFGKSLAVVFAYWFTFMIGYMLVIVLLRNNTPEFLNSQFAVYLYGLFTSIIFIYSGWKVIRQEEDLCTE